MNETSDWEDGGLRLLAGASVGRRSGRLKVVLLRGWGEGWGLTLDAADAMTAPPPNPLGLAAGMAEALESLAERSNVAMADVEALGLHDPPASRTEGAMLAAAVAVRTGLTVVSQFSAADEASGGSGRPLTPVPDWFLFRARKERRLLVHLGAALRVTLLEPRESPDQLLCFDAGPCCSFLDGLAQRMSDGALAFDPSGHFAVQGRICESLVAKWSSHPFFLQSPPRFLSPNDFDANFVDSSLTIAREMRLSARDLLCSANHFVVRNLKTALRRALPTSARLQEVRVTGGGAWNGLLWKLLQDLFTPAPIVRSDAAGIPSEALRALHAALLAYCTLENLPANLPSLTGARSPRILGQITPGAGANWDRWVCALADRLDLGRREAEHSNRKAA